MRKILPLKTHIYSLCLYYVHWLLLQFCCLTLCHFHLKFFHPSTRYPKTFLPSNLCLYSLSVCVFIVSLFTILFMSLGSVVSHVPYYLFSSSHRTPNILAPAPMIFRLVFSFAEMSRFKKCHQHPKIKNFNKPFYFPICAFANK